MKPDGKGSAFVLLPETLTQMDFQTRLSPQVFTDPYNLCVNGKLFC